MLITGTTGADTLLGTLDADLIFAYGGNDTVGAGGGNDYIDAGDGNDQVYAGDGNDYTLGLAGDDNLNGQAGDDRLFGNEGNDTLDGGVGNDLMDGGSGSDVYYVDSLGDTVVEQLASGYDLVRSSVDNYILSANVEALVLLSQPNVLKGTGNELDNYIGGNALNNVLLGLDGNDTLNGGEGQDKLDGGAGNDTLIGDTGKDTLVGGAGDDFLMGDYLNSNVSQDTLKGGAGKDIFYFNSPQQGNDSIKDFVVADDVIGISAVSFGYVPKEGAIPSDQFRMGTSAKNSSDRFIYNKSTGALYFDSDGTGGLSQIQLAKLSTGLALTYQNIRFADSPIKG